MMELTKDNVVITSDGDIFIPVIGFRDIISRLPKGKELKQQIVDDYEKARKFDEMAEFNGKGTSVSKKEIDNDPLRIFDHEGIEVTDEFYQNQKLRELIEKRIEALKSFTREDQICRIIEDLQKLLEESEK